MVEHHPPDRSLLFGQRLDGVEGVKQRVIGAADVLPAVVPPIIDEKIDRLEQFNPMPPVVGNVDRVARLEFSDLRPFERLREPRESFEVGVVRVDDADRRSRRGQLERARRTGSGADRAGTK